MTREQIFEQEKKYLQEKLRNLPVFIEYRSDQDYISIRFFTVTPYVLQIITNRYGDKYAVNYEDARILIYIDLSEILKAAEPEKKQHVILQTFDKVLVRDEDKEEWKIDLFSHILPPEETSCRYICLSIRWEQCIPYNGDTKHLLGTTDPCPIDYEIEFKK